MRVIITIKLMKITTPITIITVKTRRITLILSDNNNNDGDISKHPY